MKELNGVLIRSDPYDIELFEEIERIAYAIDEGTYEEGSKVFHLEDSELLEIYILSNEFCMSLYRSYNDLDIDYYSVSTAYEMAKWIRDRINELDEWDE